MRSSRSDQLCIIATFHSQFITGVYHNVSIPESKVFGLFPMFCYYEQHCYEHACTSLLMQWCNSFSSIYIYIKVEFPGHNTYKTSFPLHNDKLFSNVDVPIHTLERILSQDFGVLFFANFVVVKYLIVALICIFLIIEEIGHLFFFF